jgi:hypothetical protein
LAAAVNCTEAPPVPFAGGAIVSHDALLVAVHEQCDAVAMVTVLAPPLAATAKVVPLSEYVHPASCCDTVKVTPAIVSVPVRATPTLAATSNDTDPFPEPLAGGVSAIHELLLDAFHVQPAPEVTATETPVADPGGSV